MASRWTARRGLLTAIASLLGLVLLGPPVAAELLYQPLSYRFVQDMLAVGGDAVDRFGGYYASADKTPARVAAIAAVQVP